MIELFQKKLRYVIPLLFIAAAEIPARHKQNIKNNLSNNSKKNIETIVLSNTNQYYENQINDNYYNQKYHNTKNYKKNYSNYYKRNRLEEKIKKTNEITTEIDFKSQKNEDIKLNNSLPPYYKNYEKKLLINYKEQIIESAHRYNIPGKIFFSCLIYERGTTDSATGRIGPGQMTPDSLLDSLRYIYNNKITSSPLWNYTYLIRIKNKTKKERIAKEILYNNYLNIEASAAYLAKMHSLFPNWSLALSTYNLGPSIMADLLSFYKGKLTKQWWPGFVKRDKYNRFIYKGLINIDEMKKFIIKYHITFNKLTKDRAVKNYLKRLEAHRWGSQYFDYSYSYKVLEISRKISGDLYNNYN